VDEMKKNKIFARTAKAAFVVPGIIICEYDIVENQFLITRPSMQLPH